MDELMLLSGGDKKPAPGSTGSSDLDKALEKMKNDILNGPLNQPIKWPS